MTTIMLVLDIDRAYITFLETGLARMLLERGARLVVLVPDALVPYMRERYPDRNLIFEPVREKDLEHRLRTHRPELYARKEHVRRASVSRRIPLTYVDTHRRRREFVARDKREKANLFALRPVIWLLRHSRLARRVFRAESDRLFASDLYADLFERYRPDLLVCNTAGWRQDQQILREAARRGIRTATIIIGWDNTSSQGLPGAPVEHAIVWSEIQKQELVDGVDWPAHRVHIGGVPLYDNYINQTWLWSREEYFARHRLDPGKKLIAFAATALSITPNLHLIRLLADMVAGQEFGVPAQLLIRMHPVHGKSNPDYWQEVQDVRELAKQYADVRIVEPGKMPGEKRYSGDVFTEKVSMLAHCDLLVTIYSTMVVEAAIFDKPFVSACIDPPAGWPNSFSIPLHEVPSWPTASRVNRARAGKLALDPDQLRAAIRAYLVDPAEDGEARRAFLARELTYTDGSATRKTAEIIWGLARGEKE